MQSYTVCGAEEARTPPVRYTHRGLPAEEGGVDEVDPRGTPAAGCQRAGCVKSAVRREEVGDAVFQVQLVGLLHLAGEGCRLELVRLRPTRVITTATSCCRSTTVPRRCNSAKSARSVHGHDGIKPHGCVNATYPVRVVVLSCARTAGECITPSKPDISQGLIGTRHRSRLVAVAVGAVSVDAVVDVALAAAQHLHQPREVLPHHRVPQHHDVDTLHPCAQQLHVACRQGCSSRAAARRACDEHVCKGTHSMLLDAIRRRAGS